jgi:poly(hydroxyalkanoate) depolymerase family esterase
MADRGWTAESARASGGSRNFKLWVPATLDKGRAAPLVLLLHGCKHNAAETAEISGMNEIADANGFLVAYPEQSRRANLLKCWNWFDPKHQTRDAGEPSILAAVVDQVCSTHNVDPDRVYVAGVSAGGAMACILAATYPDIFAAVAILAGAEFKAAISMSEGLAAMKRGGPDPVRQGQLAFEAMRTGLRRKDKRHMPVIVFHGTADTRVSPVNADQTIAQWSKTNACLAAEQAQSGFALTENIIRGEVPGGYGYQKHSYVEADARLLLEKWLVDGLGHAWPGSPKPSKYADPKGPNASAEIWRFFCEASHSMASFSPGPSHAKSGEASK